MATTKSQAWMIHCQTGCSCCRNDNHWCGPFSSPEIAEIYKQEFHDRKKLASQYAPNGYYSISAHDAELMDDGRIIVGSRIFEKWADDNGWEELDSDDFERG